MRTGAFRLAAGSAAAGRSGSSRRPPGPHLSRSPSARPAPSFHKPDEYEPKGENRGKLPTERELGILRGSKCLSSTDPRRLSSAGSGGGEEGTEFGVEDVGVEAD